MATITDWKDIHEGTLWLSDSGNTYVVTRCARFVCWANLSLSVAAGGDRTGSARDFDTSVSGASSLRGFENEGAA